MAILARLERLGDWSAQRPWRALGAWFAFVLACLAIGVATGEKSLENGAAGESKRGYEIANRYHLYGEPHEEVLIQGAGLGTADLKALGRRVVGAVSGIPTVHEVRAPVLSSDGHSTVVVFAVGDGVSLSRLQAAVAKAQRSQPGAQLGLTGDPSVEKARDDASSSDLSKAERLSVPITLVILFAVFGAAVSAAIPVLLALSAVAVALGLLGPLSQLAAMDSAAKPVLVLIGMAVGVDYSLFYVVRDRQERRAGVGPPARCGSRHIRRAARCSSRASPSRLLSRGCSSPARWRSRASPWRRSRWCCARWRAR